MLSTSAPEQWLESFTRYNYNKESVKLLGREVFNLFMDWCGENNIKYDTTSQKLGISLKNLKIDGVEKGDSTVDGKMKVFNINKLKEHFNLKCLVEV
jgi:hypothetical protein